MTSLDIEIAMANYLNYRRNLIVPNVFWGLNFNYEIDLLKVTNSGYAMEVEIKVSLSDLKAEKNKKFWAHRDDRIKQFYFAVPEKLKEKALELIPERAGLFVIREGNYVSCVKKCKINKNAIPLKEHEINKLRELAAMRLWKLKKALFSARNKIKELKNE